MYQGLKPKVGGSNLSQEVKASGREQFSSRLHLDFMVANPMRAHDSTAKSTYKGRVRVFERNKGWMNSLLGFHQPSVGVRGLK